MVEIPFDTYQMRYPQINQSFQTFRAVWLRGPEAELNDVVSFRTRNQSISDHIRGALERIAASRRNFPIAMLLVGIEGKPNISEAWTATEEGVLRGILQIQSEDGVIRPVDVLDITRISPQLRKEPVVSSRSVSKDVEPDPREVSRQIISISQNILPTERVQRQEYDPTG